MFYSVTYMYISQKLVHPKTWKLPYQSWNFNQDCSFQWKNSLFIVVQHWCKATFFKINQVKLPKLLKSCWRKVKLKINSCKLSAKSILLWLLKKVEGGLWGLDKLPYERDFHITTALLRNGCYAKLYNHLKDN